MTNDKPKREDAPIAWRVSDNTIECVLDDTNPWESNPHINQLLKSRRKFALDLKDAHTTLGVLQGEVSRCSDFAATLGIENDGLRDSQKRYKTENESYGRIKKIGVTRCKSYRTRTMRCGPWWRPRKTCGSRVLLLTVTAS